MVRPYTQPQLYKKLVIDYPSLCNKMKVAWIWGAAKKIDEKEADFFPAVLHSICTVLHSIRPLRRVLSHQPFFLYFRCWCSSATQARRILSSWRCHTPLGREVEAVSCQSFPHNPNLTLIRPLETAFLQKQKRTTASSPPGATTAATSGTPLSWGPAPTKIRAFRGRGGAWGMFWV